MTVEPVSLREHVDALLEAHHREHGLESSALLAALLALQLAMDKAESTNAQWRVQQNEWRGTLADQNITFVRRQEFDTYRDSLDKRLSAAERETIHRAETNAAAINKGAARLTLLDAQMADVRNSLVWTGRALVGVLLAVLGQAIWVAITRGSL